MVFYLFDIFRWLLFVFVTIYFCVTTARNLWGWYEWLSGQDRYTGLLRNYIIVQSLRVRAIRFWGDLLVCALLCVAFLLMWYCHIILADIVRSSNVN